MTDAVIEKHIGSLLQRYPQLQDSKKSIVEAYQAMQRTYKRGKKLLIAGNGGSAADAGHIAGELMKSFRLARPLSPDLIKKMREIDDKRGRELSETLEFPLTAISLTAHEALSTAFGNDVGALGVFAQQLLGFGRQGDVFLAISTSGNSENILRAAVLAKAMGIYVIGLTGQNGGELAHLADTTVKVPESETYMIQELHLPIYHCWCMMLEEYFFGLGK